MVTISNAFSPKKQLNSSGKRTTTNLFIQYLSIYCPLDDIAEPTELYEIRIVAIT